MATPSLFEPVRIGALELPNRIAMAPMTRNRSPGTVPTALNALYYRQRASAGLIITEASQIAPEGVGYPNTPGIHTEAQVEAWRQVTDAVHAEGGRVFIQLWHVGRISHPSLQPGGALPVAPSAIRPEGQSFTYEGLKDYVTPRALDIGEIPGVVEAYARATRNARAAGFDGVEIHAANGYLIDQFLRSGSNHRDDAYGGPVDRRARFLLEVTDAVVAAWDAGRVGVRLSPCGGFNSMHDDDPAETFTYAARALGERALAYLHVIEFVETHDAFDFGAIRDAFGGPYMANGAYDLAKAARAIGQGRADLVSFGVPFIANPDLPERLASGAPLAEADQATFYGGNEKGYTDYPPRNGG